MANFPKYEKDPNAILDYEIDWAAQWLSGDTIQTSTWIVPSGITKVTDTSTTTTATIWLSGGTVGTTYEVTNRITTAGGRTQDQTLVFKIKEQ
jgi:hypothetical protein